MSLEFTGWRGIWVAYKEIVISWRGLSLTGINFADTICIDILSFVDGMSSQSGDKIVPPLKRTLYTKMH